MSEQRSFQLWWRQPAAVFMVLSIVFGTLMIVVTPPLGGPDEAAHFLRAYGIAQGNISPSTQDAMGRKGIFLPARLHTGFAFFEAVQARERKAFGNLPTTDAVTGDPPKSSGFFVLYEGSEGYTPVPYLAHSIGALVAQSLALEFTATLYLMRFAGLLMATAILVGAIALTPYLSWTFLSIAMLPAALYGRAVVSADGATLAYTLMVTVLFVRSATGFHIKTPIHAVWMSLCILSKPPQIVFILLELLQRRCGHKRLAPLILVVLPGLLASLIWLAWTGADTGSWRYVELTGAEKDQFTLTRKLMHIAEYPFHFPTAVIRTLSGITELWRQLVGVLGMFDVVLWAWVYPIVSVLVLLTCYTQTDQPFSGRLRIATIAGLTAVAYCMTIFLISYVAWTPLKAEQVWGVQGRYFIPALPLFAILLASMINRAPPRGMTAAAAICSALISGMASVEAIIRVGWRF